MGGGHDGRETIKLLKPELTPQAAAGSARPQSLADHVDQALDRVKGLGPKQRLALHNEMLRMLRDIEVIRLVAHSARGPSSEAAVRADDGWPPR